MVWHRDVAAALSMAVMLWRLIRGWARPPAFCSEWLKAQYAGGMRRGDVRGGPGEGAESEQGPA